jgi:hypothetical protein
MLAVGDEASFLSYEEQVIYDIQKFFRSQSGMENIAVIEMSAALEDLIYVDTLKHHNLPHTANVWSQAECITYFQGQCNSLIRKMEARTLNWKKIFEENTKHPQQVLRLIMQDETEAKSSKLKSSKSPSVPAIKAVGGAEETPAVKKEKPPPRKKTPAPKKIKTESEALALPMSAVGSLPDGTMDVMNSADFDLDFDLELDFSTEPGITADINEQAWQI